MQNRFVRSEDEREKSVMSTREVRKEGIWRQTNERKYASQRARRDEKLKKKRKPQAFWLDSTVQLSSITILLHGIGGRRCCGEKKLAETRQTLLFSSRPNNNNFWYITVQCWIIYRWQKKIEFSLEMKVISVFISACAKRRKCFCFCVAVMWARDWRINSTSSFSGITLTRLSIIQIRLGEIWSRFIDSFM